MGAHNIIKDRKYYKCGNKLTSTNCMVLSFDEVVSYYSEYKHVDTKDYGYVPKENELVRWPKKKALIYKIRVNNKTIYFTSILAVFGLSREQDLCDLLDVSCLTDEYLESIVDRLNKEGVKYSVPKLMSDNFLASCKFEGSGTRSDFMKKYSCAGLMYQMHHDEIVDDVYVYDINSQFPYIASTVSLPYTYVATLYQPKYESIKKLTYVTMATIVGDLKPNRLPLSIRYESEREMNILNRGIHFTGYTTCLTSLDVNYIYENYDNVNIKFWQVDIYLTRDDLFRDYLKKVIDEKNNTKINGDLIGYKLAKLKVNSFIGKIGSESFCKTYGKNKKVFYTHYPLHRYILSYSRISLSNIINKIIEKYGKDSFYYSDTDSIHCSLTPEQFSEFATLGNELGEFKLEHHYEHCWYRDGFKSYIGRENNKIVCKLSGIKYCDRDAQISEYEIKEHEHLSKKNV